ncbi:MAG TPA: hypothetical protein DCL41_04590 [Bdellovibrionales bacterium]|nr:hypothetical protein [Bdellovibrionales bacterium]
MITWCVKTSIKAKYCKCEGVDIFVCADVDDPACLFQNTYINKNNYQGFLKDLRKVFDFHPLAKSCKFFRNRDSFMQAIRSRFAKEQDALVQAYFLSYLQAYEKRTSPLSLSRYHHSEITLHNDINEYHKKHHEIPFLLSPSPILKQVKTKKKKLGDRIFVALNFRLRAQDKNTDDAWLERDSDIGEWMQFLRYCVTVYPNLCFVLLGKLEEKPSELLSLENCFVPRLNNQDLAHELAWVEESDFFMGSSSGFAAMANFSKTPYIITKITKSATGPYCIPFGSQKLPFAQGFQKLIYETESKELLVRLTDTWLHFSSNLKKSKVMPKEKITKANPKHTRALDQKLKKPKTLSEIHSLLENGQYHQARKYLNIELLRGLLSESDLSTFHHYCSKVLYEFREYAQAKAESIKVERKFISDEHQTLVEQINASLLLENIDRFLTLNPETESGFLGLEIVRARCLFLTENYMDASRALQRHAERFPADPAIEEINKSIKQRFENEFEK